MGVDAGEVDETTVVLGMLVVPQRLHRVEVLVSDSAALREVGAERPELCFEIAGPDAEHHPTSREHVEGRQLLGKHEGIALGKNDDAGGQTDRRGVRRRPRQREQRVERRVLWAHRRWRHLWIRQHDMFARPHGVEASRFGGPRRRDKGVWLAHRTHVDVDQSKPHLGTLPQP